MRIPYAAQTLIDQVADAKPKTKAEPVGEPDGFEVYRTIEFNPATSKWLEPLLTEIADPRIKSLETSKQGALQVTFVATIKADDRRPFPLDEAITVLHG